MGETNQGKRGAGKAKRQASDVVGRDIGLTKKQDCGTL